MSALKQALLGDEFYVPPFQRHSETSHDAALAISKHIGPLHAKVLGYLTQHKDGATDEQIIDALNLGPSTVRPRRIELVQNGHVINSGRYALTRSGRRASVWILKPQSAADSIVSPPS